jgi:hypothetical protein
MVRELVKQSMKLWILTSRRVRAGWTVLVAEVREEYQNWTIGGAENATDLWAVPTPDEASAEPGSRASRVPDPDGPPAQRRDRGPRRRGRSPGPGRALGGAG